MSFETDSIDLFSGAKSAHMGAHQYIEHAGSRNGQSMSGCRLWGEIESSELSKEQKNIFNGEEGLIQEAAKTIGHFIPSKTPLLEMGPGTVNAFRNKALPLLKALNSREYTCVDKSKTFLNNLVHADELKDFECTPINDDFFSEEERTYTKKSSALLCMTGCTIGNIPSPLSTEQPKEYLTNNLRQLGNRINNGWLFISFDADQNGERIINYYNKHTKFHLNIFDRMSSELKILGNFSANAFSYKAIWIEKACLLAHMAVANRHLNFSINEESFNIKKGQAFHIKNSYKFLPIFFASCCKDAGLDVVKKWETNSQKNVWLLRKSFSIAPIMRHQSAIATYH